MKQQVTVLLFHPRLEISIVNKALMEVAQSVEGVTVKDMYELYPDFNILIKKEQADLLATDVLVMQHPFYWYSTPPLLKQWYDLVLEHGWAYGHQGDKLKGKKVFHCISTGGGDTAYSRDGKHGYSLNELLRPIELTYKLCQMQLMTGLHASGTFKLHSQQLQTYLTNYRNLLQQAVAGSISNTK